MKSFLAIVGLGACFMFGCDRQHSSPSMIEQNETTVSSRDLSSVVERYFDVASQSQGRQLVTHYPPRFVQCGEITRNECDRKLSEQRDLARTSGSEIYVAIETSPTVESYRSRIAAKKLRLIKLESIWISGHDARVRVRVDSTTGRDAFDVDVLLTFQDGWKIFELVKPDDYPGFAPSSSDAQSF